MIARVDHPAKHKPIPDYLRIVVKDQIVPEQRAEDMAGELREAAFDPDRSRVLVFCTSRRQTEEQAETFDQVSQPEDPWRGRVGSFHAGMDKEERDEVFDRFKDGRVLVLFATKAFGMGMDVPNIHYVFHYTPPSSLEDYLQEIGRAGRHAGMREEAGFSVEAPIRCVLYATADDFKKNKDRLHKGHLSWVELPRIQDVLHRYAIRVGALSKARAEATDPAEQKLAPPVFFPLPLDLVEQADEYRETKNPEALQRMGLYWLEQLGRIRLGNYLPAHLEFRNAEVVAGDAYDDSVQALCRVVATARAAAGAADTSLLVSTDDLFRATKTTSFASLFQVIAQAQKHGLVRLNRYIRLRLTKKRSDEVEAWIKEDAAGIPSFLEAAYALAESILKAIPADRPLVLDLEWLNAESRRLADEHLGPREDGEQAARKAEREVKDFLRASRAKAVLRTVQDCPAVLFRRELGDAGVTYLLRLDERGSHSRASARKEQKEHLEQYRSLTARLLKRIHRSETAGESINLIDLLIEEDFPNYDLEFLESVLLFLKWMGYIHMSSIVPTAIEAYLYSVRPVDGTDQDSTDHRIYTNYEENRRLKVLRLAALQTLALTQGQERQNQFIIEYFQTEGADDVLERIEAVLLEHDPKHPLIQELRQAALKELEEKLSDEQRSVYGAQLDRSVMVVAGPGSGKTHTLLLRLARLIHEANIDPSAILVLAYNRAVVTEIKHRLSRLFAKLGYRSLVSSLRVFTFHGLIKYCLRDELDDLDLDNRGTGDPWVERFLKIARTEPGKITRRLDPQAIRYVFIDEFQDITQPRYQMLRWLARPHCAVTVIGDPNQSIYGYERTAEDGATRASEPYFEQFQSDYTADEYRLLGNFRSFEKIIRAAEDLIALNATRRLREPLTPVRSVSGGWREDYVQRYEGSGIKWFDVLQSVLEERNERGEPYRDVALLFRSNAEVYLAYQRIQDQLRHWLRQHDATVTVQGDGVSLMRVRELSSFLGGVRRDQAASFAEYGHDRLPPEYLDALVRQLEDRQVPSSWSRRLLDILRAVLREYENEDESDPTFTSLLDFVEELLKKDHGQLYKLIQMENAEESRLRTAPDIILSNIHKVKGLEFDAVLMPPSFAPLPFDLKPTRRKPSAEELEDMFDEERRVYYVGMTRARDRLILFDWRREEGLRAGTPFQPDEETNRRLGIPFKGDPYDGSIVLFRCANSRFIRTVGGFKDEAHYMDYLHREVAVGDPLQFVCIGGKWYVQHGRYRVAALSGSGNRYLEERLDDSRSRPSTLEGLVVTEIVRHTFEESQRTDAEHGTTFSANWSPFFSKKVGFTYITNFAGYAVPIRSNHDGT